MDGPMSSPDGERIAALAREVHVDLDTYAERYPIFDRARFPAVALTTAVHVPDLTRADRALLALLTVWIFAFDEVVDEARLSVSELDTLITRCKTIVRGTSPCLTPHPEDKRDRAAQTSASPVEDQLCHALHDLARQLATYRSFSLLAEHWHTSFELMVDGIVREQRLGAALAAPSPASPSTVPSYDALMETALHSIGVPCYLAACFIAYGDPALAGRLAELRHIGEACARAFRLANDLRTWEKEEREGIFNTLVAVRTEIGRADPDLSAAECQERGIRLLTDRLAVHVAQTWSLLAASPMPNGAVEMGIARLVEFVTMFYAAHDYHTFRSG